MSSIFSRIINGELPGRFVWRDEFCVAILTINPLAPGHTLVIPRAEVDHWIDLAPELSSHLWAVAQKIGVALQEEYTPIKVGVLVVGEEVPHTHIHLVPFHGLEQLNFANADSNPDPAILDNDADRIRARLKTNGHGESGD